MPKVDNRRIARNTLYMYLRMLVSMFVALFTTRINFQALGVDNFGIYNVVGSVIVFFTFINQGLTTATRRYITAELAQGDKESRRNVFNLAIGAHIGIAFIIIILGETVGLWAVNYLLNIPSERVFAANVVYQLSIFTAVVNVMQAPYTASITAHEKMDIYAYISIFEIFAKLAVAYGVLYLPGDKLIVYAVLLTLTQLIVILLNGAYCHRKFSMCHFQRPHDKNLLKEIFGYMGWNLAGQAMVVLTNQGVTVLVNMFFNVAANAAMGVSNQITHIVSNFVSNFQIAFNPQITKLYVSKETDELIKLANRCSRISSYLVLVFIIPISFQIHNFLTIWLDEYPDYTVEFCIYTLIAIFIDAISAPLWMILASDKNIKKYQTVLTTIYSFNFLGALLALWLGAPPYSVIVVRIFVYMLAVSARLLLVKEKLPMFSINQWLWMTLARTCKIVILPFLLMILLSQIHLNSRFLELILFSGLSFLMVCISIYLFGLDQKERALIKEKVIVKFFHHHNNDR